MEPLCRSSPACDYRSELFFAPTRAPLIVASSSMQVVGYTTSGSYGCQVRQSLAMAYLPTFLTTPGTEVEVELLGSLCSARVLPGAPAQVQALRRKPAL